MERLPFLHATHISDAARWSREQKTRKQKHTKTKNTTKQFAIVEASLNSCSSYVSIHARRGHPARPLVQKHKKTKTKQTVIYASLNLRLRAARRGGGGGGKGVTRCARCPQNKQKTKKYCYGGSFFARVRTFTRRVPRPAAHRTNRKTNHVVTEASLKCSRHVYAEG